MEMIAAVGLLFAGFGLVLTVLFFAFIFGIAAGERVGARTVVPRR